MKDKIVIRPIELRDLPFVKDVLNDVIANHNYYLSEHLKTDEDMRRWYDEHQNNDLYIIFVAEIDGMVAGWISLSNYRSIDGYNISVELSVYVSDRYYRMGVASVLMGYIEDYARNKKQIHKIVSVITSTNLPSIALHEKYGYNCEGILKEVAIKNGSYQDVVFMSKIIH